MLKLKPYSVLVEDAETKEQIPLTAIKGEQGLPGQPGRDGVDGQDGQPGQDGYTPVKGVDYYTDAEKSALETEVQGVVESNIQGTLDDIQDKVDEVEAIAKGRSAGYVFDTEDAMTTWVAVHSDELNLGDNLYIRATDVPDYWWDGTLVQPLETQKVDLTEYAKTSTVNTELGKKQDKLTAGTNITISGTTISAKSDSTKQDKLTAGTNITISGTTISAKSDTTKQDKLVSGTNIKTVNGESLLGSGNIEIKGGGSGDGTVDSTVAIDVIPPSSDPEYINVQNELDGIKEEIGNVNDRIDHVDEVIIETVEPLQKQADATDRSLDALWKLNKGQTYDIETKEENGMNNAPSGAEFLTMEEVYGHSLQETTQGYNLVDIGVMTTQEMQSVGYFSPPYSRLKNTVKLKAGVTYTIYCFARKFGDSRIRWNNLRYNATNTATNFGGYVETEVSKEGSIAKRNFTPTEDYEGQLSANHQFHCSDYVNPTSVELVWQMVVEGNPSTAPNYEPYTNGASPNPDYPKPITSVEEINVTVEGKNLLDDSVSKRTFTSGTLAFNVVGGQQVFKKLKKGTYTFSVKLKTLTVTNLYCADKDGNRIFSEYSKTSKTFTLAEDKELRFWSFDGSFTSVNDIVYAQVEVGDKVTDYVPYEEPKTTTIIPPFPMNAITENGVTYRDVMDVENGVWERKTGKWFVTRSVFEIVVTDKTSYIRLNSTAPNFNNVFDAPLMSNYFKGIPHSVGDSGGVGICYAYFWRLYFGVGTSGDEMMDKFVSMVEDTENPLYAIYKLKDATTEPISAADLEFLKSLELTPTDHTITVTDQDGNDIEWLAEYIISLREVQ